MKVELKKIFVSNGNGEFMGIDSASGSYPYKTHSLSKALMYDANDQEGMSRLQSYVSAFSNKSHGGRSDFYDILNGFQVVTATITFNLKVDKHEDTV